MIEVANRRTGRKRDAFIVFLMGLFVFSPLSSFITIDVLHLPLSLPEFLFVFFIPFFYKKFCPERINWKVLSCLILFWSAFVAISFISGDYTVFEIVGCSRTYLYIIIFFAIFFSNKNTDFRLMAFLSYGAIAGWCIDVIINLLTMTIGDKMMIGYGPMIAIPIALAYPALNGQKMLCFLLFILCICIGIFGALRRVMFVSLAVYICLNIYFIIHDRRNRSKILGGCIVLVICFVIAYPTIKELIHDYSWDLYVRVVLKSEDMFSGESNSGDETRTMVISDFFNSLHDYLVPRGFISKQYSTSDTGIFNDFPLTELSHTFGIVLTFIFFLLYGLRSVFMMKEIDSGMISKNHIVFPLGFLTICILVFMEGSFLTFPYQSIYTGYLLSGLTK